jgi:hypothetical protein
MNKHCVIPTGTITLICLLLSSLPNITLAQTSGAITVYGDFNKYYPVTWFDGNWYSGLTELQITRPDVHENSSWRGSLMSKFNYHVTNWGHGASYIEPFITSGQVTFIAGWRDATPANSTARIIIWLRGGGTTYHYTANVSVAPIIYDGVQNGLPFNEINGPSHSYKDMVDAYVNSSGWSDAKDTQVNGSSYFMGNVGIGTRTLTDALNVNGKIRAEEMKVLVDVPADYVFDKNYQLRSLEETEQFIQTNKHLPGVPSAIEIKQNGWALGEMSNMLLEKVEELTLHMIALKKENEKLHNELAKQQQEIERLKK